MSRNARASTAVVHVAGIPVHVEWRSLFVGAAIPLFWITRSPPGGVEESASFVGLVGVVLLGAVLLALGGLAHEMGHALSAQHLGVQPERVRLGLLRRAVVFPGDLPFSRGGRVTLLITLSGPLATLAYALVWLAARPWFAEAPLLAQLCELLVVFHLCLAYYNLLPIGRNDGERALAAFTASHRGMVAASGLAFAATAGLTVAAAVVGMLLVQAGIQDGQMVIVLAPIGFGLWLARGVLGRGQTQTDHPQPAANAS